MEFEKIIKNRSSVHHFLPNFQLSKNDFLDLINKSRSAPSGYNAQPWEFLLIQNKENLKKITKFAFGQKQILSSGNLVIVLGNINFDAEEADRILEESKKLKNFSPAQLEALANSLRKEKREAKKREMTIRNVSLVAMQLLLAIESKGLSACPMMGFSQVLLSEFLKLPKNIIPILMIAVGKKDLKQESKMVRLPRKPVEDLVFYEQYKKKSHSV